MVILSQDGDKLVGITDLRIEAGVGSNWLVVHHSGPDKNSRTIMGSYKTKMDAIDELHAIYDAFVALETSYQMSKG